jgi:hypothetical protein
VSEDHKTQKNHNGWWGDKRLDGNRTPQPTKAGFARAGEERKVIGDVQVINVDLGRERQPGDTFRITSAT